MARGAARGDAVTVQIDWNNIARRARQMPVPGDNLGGLVASPTGSIGRVHRQHRRRPRRRRRAAAGAGTAGIYIVNVETSAVDARAAVAEAGGGGGGGRGGGAAVAVAAPGAGKWCSRATAARCTSAPAPDCYAAPVGGGGGGGAARGSRRRRAAAAAAAARRRRRRSGGAGSRGRRHRRGRSRYTATIRSITRALRAQVFNEGWRIMKNRFYDAEMHGVELGGDAHEVRAAARLTSSIRRNCRPS